MKKKCISFEKKKEQYIDKKLEQISYQYNPDDMLLSFLNNEKKNNKKSRLKTQ